MSIKCCRECKPPKRSAECHATCPEYAAEKAAADKEKEARRHQPAEITARRVAFYKTFGAKQRATAKAAHDPTVARIKKKGGV